MCKSAPYGRRHCPRGPWACDTGISSGLRNGGVGFALSPVPEGERPLALSAWFGRVIETGASTVESMWQTRSVLAIALSPGRFAEWTITHDDITTVGTF